VITALALGAALAAALAAPGGARLAPDTANWLAMYSVARSPPRTATPRPSSKSLDRNFTCARIRSPEIPLVCAQLTVLNANAKKAPLIARPNRA